MGDEKEQDFSNKKPEGFGNSSHEKLNENIEKEINIEKVNSRIESIAKEATMETENIEKEIAIVDEKLKIIDQKSTDEAKFFVKENAQIFEDFAYSIAHLYTQTTTEIIKVLENEKFRIDREVNDNLLNFSKEEFSVRENVLNKINVTRKELYESREKVMKLRESSIEVIKKIGSSKNDAFGDEQLIENVDSSSSKSENKTEESVINHFENISSKDALYDMLKSRNNWVNKKGKVQDAEKLIGIVKGFIANGSGNIPTVNGLREVAKKFVENKDLPSINISAENIDNLSSVEKVENSNYMEDTENAANEAEWKALNVDKNNIATGERSMNGDTENIGDKEVIDLLDDEIMETDATLRYYLNVSKIENAYKEGNTQKINEEIKKAKYAESRAYEDIKEEINSLVKFLSAGDSGPDSENFDKIIQEISVSTGIDVDSVKRVYENQRSRINEMAFNNVKNSGGVKKKIAIALGKSAAYIGAGVGLSLVTGGAGAAASVALARIIETTLSNRVDKNKISEEIKSIRDQISQDFKNKGKEFKNNIIAELSLLKQQKIDKLANSLESDEENGNGDKSVSIESNRNNLIREGLITYINNNENYRGVREEEKKAIIDKTIILDGIDLLNDKKEEELKTDKRFSKNRWFAKTIERIDSFFESKTKQEGGDAKGVVEKTAVFTSVFFRGGENVAEKAATITLLAGAGVIARELPVVRRVLMGYAGMKGGEMAAKYFTSENKKRYSILRKIKESDLGVESAQKAKEAAELARVQLLDEEFKTGSASEYALLKNALDKYDQENINLAQKLQKLEGFIDDLNNNFEEKIIKKGDIKRERKFVINGARVGGAMLGAVFGPEAVDAIREYFQKDDASKIATREVDEGTKHHIQSRTVDKVTEKSTVPDSAIIRKGEGVEHALLRQLKKDPTEFGFKGDPTDASAVKNWANGEAHRIAIKTGYVDSATGHEVRVGTSGRDNVAYVLGKDGQGNPYIEEYANGKSGFEIKEGHNINTHFEGSVKGRLEGYEYPHPGSSETPQVDVPGENQQTLIDPDIASQQDVDGNMPYGMPDDNTSRSDNISRYKEFYNRLNLESKELMLDARELIKNGTEIKDFDKINGILNGNLEQYKDSIKDIGKMSIKYDHFEGAMKISFDGDNGKFVNIYDNGEIVSVDQTSGIKNMWRPGFGEKISNDYIKKALEHLFGKEPTIQLENLPSDTNPTVEK